MRVEVERHHDVGAALDRHGVRMLRLELERLLERPRGEHVHRAPRVFTLSRHGGAPPPARGRARRRAGRSRRARRPRLLRPSRANGSRPTSRSSTASSPGSGSTRAARRSTLRAATSFPGFIDAHMHLESVKLMVDEFARLVLPLGTTAVVADPHEIANVLGVDGVHWLLDASAGLQLDVFFMAPSCVPASPFESPRRPLEPGDLESLMRRRRVLGLAEMMNFPGVIARRPGRAREARARGRRARRRPRARACSGRSSRPTRRPGSAPTTRR